MDELCQTWLQVSTVMEFNIWLQYTNLLKIGVCKNDENASKRGIADPKFRAI